MITMTIQLKEFFSWTYDDVCLRKKNEIAIYMCIYIVKLENHKRNNYVIIYCYSGFRKEFVVLL